jgi:adenylosuccinate lyase
MELNTLTAISPVDGRYRKVTNELAPYFSEFGLIRYRVQVEIDYFILLSQQGLPQLPTLSTTQIENLKLVYKKFSFADAEVIKETEKTTNHDVKAVEYFVKEKLKAQDLENYLEFVHFGLTSQDINNTSIPLSLQQATDDVILPNLSGVHTKLIYLAKEWKHVSLLARTHGQPASPTRLGKEIYVFVERLQAQIDQLLQIPFSAKWWSNW